MSSPNLICLQLQAVYLLANNIIYKEIYAGRQSIVNGNREIAISSQLSIAIIM